MPTDMINLDEILKANAINPKFLRSRREYNITEIRLCPVCKGAGSLINTSYKDHVRGFESLSGSCEFCAGTGRVEMQVAITFKPLLT